MSAVLLEAGRSELLVPEPFLARRPPGLDRRLHDDLHAGGWRALHSLVTALGLRGGDGSIGIVVRAGDSFYVVESIDDESMRVSPGNACGGRCRVVRTGRPVLVGGARMSVLTVDFHSVSDYDGAAVAAFVFDLAGGEYNRRILDPLADIASICAALGACESVEKAYTAVARLAAGDAGAVDAVERFATEHLGGAGCGGACLGGGGVTAVRIGSGGGSLERVVGAARFMLDALDSVMRVRDSIASATLQLSYYDALFNTIYTLATGFPRVTVRGGRVTLAGVPLVAVEHAGAVLASNVAFALDSFTVECWGERGAGSEYESAARKVSGAAGVRLRPLACSGARVCGGGGCFELRGDNVVIAVSRRVIVPLDYGFEYVLDTSELYAARLPPPRRDTLAIRVVRPGRQALGFDYLAAGRGSSVRWGLAACDARGGTECAVSYARAVAEGSAGGAYRVAREYGFECVSKLAGHIIESMGV